ncbi:hypothetical protein GCM10009759_65250 [Kitasatospora saccharophila]|uniref:Uncharacterized protein n=1 Tax=Kitasatospora saccharophila TaxID=407973 RepID=A0ABP5JKH3_9ACTN
MPTMLYYPLVQPPQKAVHQALLYWDGIASLMPGDSDVQDEALSSELRDLKERHLYHPIALEEEYQGLLRRATEGLPVLADTLIEISGRQVPRSWILSYNSKWNDAEILNSLVDLGLARRVRNPTSFKSLAMPREVVTLLTAVMAHEVARSSANRAYTPYTDQQAPDQVALGCDPNTGVAAWRVRLGQLLPTPSPATTTQQVLEFREKYADERERLLRATQEMLVELCRNWEHPADVLRRMELELTSAREDYMDAAKSRRIAWTERSLYATVAVASAAAGALIAPDMGWVAGILGSVGFNVATREIRPLSKGQKEHPFSYLDLVDRHLA